MHETVKLLKDLIGFKTENPPGDEYKVINYVKKFFSKNKIKFKVYSKVKGRNNIIGYIGQGKPELLVSCHADTVPVGTGWKTNPFKGVVKNSRVYGRGACDNKGQLACLLYAAKELKKNESELNGTFLVGILADEEKGSQLGLKYLINAKKIKPNFAILPDIGESMKSIDIAEKGILRLQMSAKGKAAHGSRPQDGENAIVHLSQAIGKLEGYLLKHKKHRLFSKPTINIGTVQGGDAPNMVPSLAICELDIRYLPSQNTSKIIKELLAVVNNKKINLKKVIDIPPTELKDMNLVNQIQKTVKRVLGFKPKPIGLDGGTDAKALLMKGIPAIGYSCGEHSQMHVPNESIKIKELEQFSKVLIEIVKDVLN